MCKTINLFATFLINDSDAKLFSDVIEVKFDVETCNNIKGDLRDWTGTLFRSKNNPDAYGIFPVDIHDTNHTFNALSKIVCAIGVANANVEEINFIVHDKMLDDSLTKEDYMFAPEGILSKLINNSPIKEFKGTVHLLSFQHTSNPVVDMLTSDGSGIQEEIKRLLNDE